MTSPSDRVKHIDAGNMMPPGCCFMCGSVDNPRGYADLGYQIEYFGNLYLCANCSFSIVEYWGAKTADQYDIVVTERDDLEIAMIRLRDELLKLESLRDLAMAISDRERSSSTSNYGVNVGSVPGSEHNVQKTESGNIETDRNESVLIESGTISGPIDPDESSVSDLIRSVGL